MPLCNMMAMQHRKNKRGLQQLSDAQKLEAITKVQKGETKAAVAREFGVPESTLRGWCKKAKLNGHCHSVMNKSLQVTSTMSPVLLTSEMAYRDCSYSKGSGSDEGSTTHPFSDEQEDDDTTERDTKPAVVVAIPEEQRRVLDWLNYGHYPQLPTTTTTTQTQTPSLTQQLRHQQTPPPSQIIDTTKPAQPVVTSSTCDDVRNVAKVAKVSSKKDKPQSIKGSTIINGGGGGGGGGGGTYINNHNHHINNNINMANANAVAAAAAAAAVVNNNNNNNTNNNNNNNNHIINHYQNGVNGSGFYNWCKSNTSCGGYSSPVSPVSSDKNDSYDDEPLALIVPSKRRISDLETALKSQLSKMYQEQQQQQQQQQQHQHQTNGKQTLSVEEALQHGEVFLDWLRACSDPNVTVLQAMQIGTLIKNIRSSLERNQNRR